MEQYKDVLSLEIGIGPLAKREDSDRLENLANIVERVKSDSMVSYVLPATLSQLFNRRKMVPS